MTNRKIVYERIMNSLREDARANDWTVEAWERDLVERVIKTHRVWSQLDYELTFNVRAFVNAYTLSAGDWGRSFEEDMFARDEGIQTFGDTMVLRTIEETGKVTTNKQTKK